MKIPYHRPQVEGVCDCGGELYQREDDQEATIRNRLQVYNDQTSPLIDYYSQVGLLFMVDGMADIDVVQTELLNILQVA